MAINESIKLIILNCPLSFFFIMICPKKRIRKEKCTPDHNETVLGFHSERRNLRRKNKESTVQVFKSAH